MNLEFLKCWLRHKWKIISVFNYDDTSYQQKGAPSSALTFQCIYCGEIKKQSMYGHGYFKKEDFLIK